MTAEAVKGAMTAAFVLGVIVGVVGAVLLVAGIVLAAARVTLSRARPPRGALFEVPPSTLAELDKLRRLSESKDNAAVLTRALVCYALLLREMADRDAAVILRYPDGTTSELTV